MSTSDVYAMSVCAAKMLQAGNQNMNEKDYVKVIKMFFQLQFMVTKLVVSRCYNFLEKVAELQQPAEASGGVMMPKTLKVLPFGSSPSSVAMETPGQEMSDVTAGKSKSLMMAPIDTVKAGLSLTSKMATAPIHVCSYAANLSWNMVSTVSKNLLGKTSPTEEEPKAKPSYMDQEAKREFVRQLLQAKELCGKTFAQISEECAITSVYCAQLFYNQAQLKPDTAILLKKSVPTLSNEQLKEMTKAPMRTYDRHLVHEPNINRLNEAVLQYGESIKALINEDCGDGVMSNVDFFVTVDKVRSPTGEDRVQVSFNGKFVAHPEHNVETLIMYD